jgi:alpha-1,3-glucosyltransferase
MELTLHLPVGEWYWHDLDYWGLDYPPITAYVSYLCGLGSALLVGDESVALDESKGYEDPTHKTYMRATVWILDAVVYFPAVWMIAKRLHAENDWLWTFCSALAQPALLLMDHGHFQYNSTSLGFALLACYYMTRPSFRDCIIGSFYFCLALNFKQMTLYHAPAIFFYLSGRCFAVDQWFIRFGALGATVVSTFGLLWWPFLCYGPPDTTVVDRLLHILHRIFPFQRGLFEGKVSNLWCALSVKPFSIRDHLPQDMQPIFALFLTIILIVPACYKLFCVGQCDRGDSNDRRLLLWGVASTGLAFFLASFQVHEKSILMALSPLSLLIGDDAKFVQWFSIVSTWTLYPLIQVDRLQTAYICTLAIFASLSWLSAEGHERMTSFFDVSIFTRVMVPVSYIGMIMLHVLEVMVPAPSSLPDLFPVLWSIAGCAMICLAWLITCWHLFQGKTMKMKIL